MAIYMDRHDLPGVTAKDVAAAHQEDLKVQEEYGCRALTYWFDEKRQTAFCLIEAPDPESVKKMHDNAHGLIPHQIIEVNANLVEAFLGRIEHPEPSDGTDETHLVVDEPAMRTIMAISWPNIAFLDKRTAAAEAIELSRIYLDLIHTALEKFTGREVNHGPDGFLASFVSVSQAILCATEIQLNIKKQQNKISGNNGQAHIGLSTGVPVTESNELFGQTVKLARRLCKVAGKNQVIGSSGVRNLYQQEVPEVLEKGSGIKMLNPLEEKFLSQLMDTTEAAWSGAEFDVHYLAKQLGVSKSQLYRKIVSLTGQSPNDFIKDYKLNVALKLIQKQQGNISEITYQSGFTSPSYFSKCFQKKFHILPSEYAAAIAKPVLT